MNRLVLTSDHVRGNCSSCLHSLTFFDLLYKFFRLWSIKGPFQFTFNTLAAACHASSVPPHYLPFLCMLVLYMSVCLLLVFACPAQNKAIFCSLKVLLCCIDHMFLMPFAKFILFIYFNYLFVYKLKVSSTYQRAHPIKEVFVLAWIFVYCG